ncbi:MarR family winged helix-turn-helix transcriptional regulator [Burkholderia sp. lig30]|uniref:MarR family winged helix-turn-helix transcriptional regulator n=1 Tax=Burkholderia sp. lig30 TaxID=1192124 RepID=UPI0009F86163|nr:MarR family transcriptional regulator [Burkholderia sp. lig30]
MSRLMTSKSPVRASASLSASSDARAAHAAPRLRLTYLIGQLDRIVSKRLTEALVEHGLTLPQFTALSVLGARGRSSNAQLAERSFITPQSANEVVKTMEANGWVMREADPTNRRIVLLQLTDAGTALLERCNEAADRVEHAMLDELDADVADTLRTLLHACVRNLRAA